MYICICCLYVSIFGVLGALISLTFLILLLYPGSPASLSAPSYIALGAWVALGAIFFLFQLKKLRALTKEELDYLILNKDE